MRLILIIQFLFIISHSFSQKKETWAFVYQTDKFTSDALLDLRFLNENVAGEHGFIRQSIDGESFVRGDGQPIRFWATNVARMLVAKGDTEVDQMGRFLSKMGFNMVRYHGSISPKGKHSDILNVDSAEMKSIWRFVTGMKKHGIYSTVSPFWAHTDFLGGNIPAEWGLDGYVGHEELWGLIFFNDKLKEAYKHWVKILYSTPNPYTGIPLKDEPALAIIQIQNEDGLFFWTMNKPKPALKKLIQEKFSIWLIQKYGSLENAYTAWNNEQLPGDNLSQKLLDLYSTYDMTKEEFGTKAKRLNDQVTFYAETQYNFNKEIHDFLKNEVGCKQLINASNWRTANTEKLNDLERWTHTPCEVLAANRYQETGHTGINSGWQVRVGNFTGASSALKNPQELAVNLKQIKGHPFIITEGGWHFPNKYQAEGPFLISAYQSLSGVDAFYWYNMDDAGYTEDPYFRFNCGTDSLCPLRRWDLSTPASMALMPANALIYRLNYLKEGKMVIGEKRTMTEMISRKSPLISEESPFDPNRDTEFVGLGESNKVGLTPLSFFVGKIIVENKESGCKSAISTLLNKNIDYQNKLVSSSTNELKLDYEKGICVENSPYVQGVAGFLNSQHIFQLKDLTIDTNNEYASIQVVAMDKKPLSVSSKILIQVGTLYRPTNWKETPADLIVDGKVKTRFEIQNTGQMPWRCENTEATIEIRNRKIKKATLLNSEGYAVSNIPIDKMKTGIKIQLPTNAMYVVLE
jgi:hypothetical protein